MKENKTKFSKIKYYKIKYKRTVHKKGMGMEFAVSHLSKRKLTEWKCTVRDILQLAFVMNNINQDQI